RAYGKNWRAGIFVSHGSFSFADNLSHDDVKDTRLGVYGGYSNGPHNAHVYLDYGWQKNDLTRRLTGLGLNARADYNSRILELGGEYKYDLNAKNMKVWHISPYVNVQLSQLWQDGYTEGGAGIFGHRVDSQSNTYFAGGLGLEFKRYLSNGSYALRLGVKHAFAGSDPKFTYGYVGDTTNSYQLQGQNDKTHFLMSLGGEAEFAPGWTLAGDLALQKGSHDKDIMAAVTLRRMW
uniref:autotransporter outer membrane beta-barrel domain-containing protein n=1 Tax=Anaerovibrio sp. RM50 TaxID=1200557 RepID=UPI000489A958